MNICKIGLKPWSVLFFALILFAGCGGSDSKDKEAAKDTKSDETNAPGSLSINTLAAAYPEGLSISSFPDEIDETPGVAAAGTLAIETNLSSKKSLYLATEVTEENTAPKHPKKILQETKERLDGSADRCFEPGIMEALLRSSTVSEYCFGFDYGIISGESIGTGDTGQINPTVTTVSNANPNFTESDLKTALLGKVTPNSAVSKEACMVAVSKLLVSSATGKVDSALNLFQGMLCEAKKQSKVDSLPKVGSLIDLVSVFETLGEEANHPNPANFTSASLTRLPDQDSKTVYKSSLAFVLGGGPNSPEFNITLVHSPNDEKNETYKGVLSVLTEIDSKQVGTSINYQKSGKTLEDSNLKFEVRTMNLSEGTILNSKGAVDFVSPPEDAGNNTLSGIKYFAFDINPSTYAGKLSFWVNPGGSYSEAPRGFIFETEQNDSGALSGCAYGGAYREGSIRKAFKTGASITVSGCFTPQISGGVCGNTGDNQGSQFWKQCFSQNPETGVYEVTTDTPEKYEVLNATQVTVPTVDLSTIETVEKTE